MRATGTESPATAGADFARPGVTTPSPRPAQVAAQAAPPPRQALPATADGPWKIQLGAFSVAGNADKLWSQLEAASKASGEKLWRMPLDQSYRDEMTNTITDLKNLGNLGRYGGACSAAGFLEHFIEDGTPWAHIDIAGTAWIKSDKPTVPKGGTGYGVRLLYRLVLDNYA